MFDANMQGPCALNPNENLHAEQATSEDRVLVSALQRADAAAYEALIQRFQTPIYNLVWRLLDNAADAGDVTQEVFLKIFRSIDGFRGDSSLKTWVYRIAVNEAHNKRRWLFRHKRNETAIDEIYPDENSREAPLVDPSETPFDFAMNREALAILEEGLASISPAFREVLVLREIEDLSYEDIAGILDVSMGTVKSRLVRGRDALRRYLNERLNPVTGTLTPVPVVAK